MTDQTSAAADEGTLKRSIQMKWFTSAKQKAAVAAKAFGPDGGFKAYSEPCGQIIGNIFDVKEKTGQLPDGTDKVSLLAIGEFEAINYVTGEVVTSTAAYLPTYYLETVQSILNKDSGASVVVALEIVLAATGKSIPVAYEVKNLVRRRPENPLNALKAEMAEAGRLRLPPPPAADTALIEGEVRRMEPVEVAAEGDNVVHDDAAAEVPPKTVKAARAA